jgi:hypothetical protein
VSNKWIAIAAVIVALVPAPAAAQFTTFIAPPDRVKDSVQAVVTAEKKAVEDSVARAQISDMKTWVDSAAGVMPQRTLDSAMMLPPATTFPDTVAPFREGARAPATATSLPLMLLLGTLLTLSGLLLVRAPEPSRVRPRRR